MIIYRPIESKDLDKLKTWRNSNLIKPYVREYRLLNDDDQHKWYECYLSSRRKADFDQEIVIFSDKDGDFAVGGLTRIEWKNQKAEITFYNTRIGYSKDCLELIIKFAFDEFNIHKIYWPVYSHDPRIEEYKEIFGVEATLREEYWHYGFKDRVYLFKFNPKHLIYS